MQSDIYYFCTNMYNNCVFFVIFAFYGNFCKIKFTTFCLLMFKNRTLIVVKTLMTQGDIYYLVYNEQFNINIHNNCLNNFSIFRQIIIMTERHAEPMEFEEEMTPPSFRKMKRYKGNDSQVSEVDLENSCFDTDNECRIVSHVSFVSTREGGEMFPRNEITPPPISSLIKKTGIFDAPGIARKDDHNEVSASNRVTSNKCAGNSEIPKNVLPSRQLRGCK